MRHTCHWPGCPREVRPALWGCPEHWFKLPLALRRAILKHYVPGQEISKTPSAEYLATARLVQGWIAGDVVMRADGVGFDVKKDLVF
jgi:hypothetical protein